MKRDPFMVGNATTPGDINLFPWGLDSELRCDEALVYFDVELIAPYEEVSQLKNIKMNCSDTVEGGGGFRISDPQI